MTALAKLLRRSCAIVTSGALVVAGLPAMAQDQPPAAAQQRPAAQQSPQAQQPGQGQLERLLAPIALYPDDLVAQILTASTYPLEVVQAARWVNEHSNVQGQALQDAMQQQPWDASVKGLTAVPQVLAMMNDKLDWTQQVGEAFLAQANDVSNAIQQLRAKAAANGNLKTSKQLKVSSVAASGPPPAPPPPDVDPAMLPPPPPAEYIMIEPYDPDLYYVPVYDPMVVYGPWPWVDYEPFYWYPPGYVLGAAIIGFGVGFFVGAALWCHYNWGGGGGWGGGGVVINVARYNQFNHTNLAATRGGYSNWQFNKEHRGTVGFRNTALSKQYGSKAAPSNFQSTLQGNHSLNTGPLNAKGNTNLNVNRSFNANSNLGVNKNLNVNSNLNANRNLNVNRNLTVNRSFNPSSMNLNRGMNINRGASFAGGGGRPAGGGGGGGRPPPGKPHH